jgi:hypothetical protein
MLVKEVLESMGRSKDTDNVLGCLQAHLITTNDDILALTKDYCTGIEMPWGLIVALKSKIRSYNIQLGDAWSMQGQNTEALADVTVSLSAPHIARNREKIEHVVRRQSSKELPTLSRGSSKQMPIEIDDNTSDWLSTTGIPSLPEKGGLSPHALSSASGDEMKKMKVLLEDHEKCVNRQVDECRQFVKESMEKTIEALEQRLLPMNNREARDIPLTSITAEPAI